MILRAAILAIFMIFLAGWEPLATATPAFQVAQLLGDSNDKAVMDAEVARQMNAARFYKDKGNNPQAINRFRTIIVEYQISPYVEEALAHISDAYLALGMKPEAQCAVAVLQQKFPDSPWSHQALDKLKSAGLEPADDQKNWIWQAFNGARL
jgi:outer membrane protein assembly factor BamD